MAIRHLVVAAALAAAHVCLAARPALAQPKPPVRDGGAAPKPPGGTQAPPGTRTDMELDPDSKPAPAEPPPLPPAQPGQWGVGGKDEEGKFAPPTAKKPPTDEEAAAKAKEDEAKPVDLGPERAASLDMVFGFGSIHDVTNDAGQNGGKTLVPVSVSLIFSFSWRIFDIWTLGARFPFTKASLTGPLTGASDDYNTFAAGNLELYVRPSFPLTRRLRLPAQISFFLPTAQGDIYDTMSPDGRVPFAQALVNQAASASRGWEEMPLFASRRLGIRAGVGITYDTDHIHVAAGTRFDVMGKISGADATTGFVLRSPTTAWLTGASFFYGFNVGPGTIEPGLRTWFVLASVPAYTTAADDSGPQFVLEPAVSARFPVNEAKTLVAKGGLGFILPVVGPLGGGVGPTNSSIKGFRVNAEFQF